MIEVLNINSSLRIKISALLISTPLTYCKLIFAVPVYNTPNITIIIKAAIIYGSQYFLFSIYPPACRGK